MINLSHITTESVGLTKIRKHAICLQLTDHQALYHVLSLGENSQQLS